MLHPATEKRAKPLQLTQLERLAAWLDAQIAHAIDEGDQRARLTHGRNKALVLLGFWRGFRSDELSRLQIEHVTVESGRGMTLFLPRTKGDRSQLGTSFRAPALSRLCPVAARETWISVSGLTAGPAFRGIDRWGNVRDEGLHAGSFVPLLRALFRAADVPAPDSYSSHSLRRGFATWANANAWDLKMLMEYDGWKDVRSAMRYIDAADSFAQHRIESALAATPGPALPQPEAVTPEKASLPVASASMPPVAETRLTLHLFIERNSKFVRGKSKAHRWIEDFCLAEYWMRCLNKRRTEYEIVMPFSHGPELEAAIEDLLAEMHATADLCHCWIEMSLHDPVAGTAWG